MVLNESKIRVSINCWIDPAPLRTNFMVSIELIPISNGTLNVGLD